MKALPQSAAVLGVARRVVWFEPPEQAIADPPRFLAYVMTYATPDDLAALRGVIGPDEYREALEHAPPGIFDVRSWAYWNLVCGRQPAPPMPRRFS